MADVYLGLGANLGNRKLNLKKALEALSSRVEIIKVSPIYETDPVGFTEQPLFLNIAIAGKTRLKPKTLLEFAKEIEINMGRVPGQPNAPRPIDIDILFYGDKIIRDEELIIPHPRLTVRAFVLVPLNDIAPELVHPDNKRKIKQLYKDLGEIRGVHRWGEPEEIWKGK